MRTSSRRAGAKVENGVLVFQGAYFAPSFARASLDARAPNQLSGLACAVQGHPRAALDTNDLRIRRLRAQHPVEPDCQSACRRYLRQEAEFGVGGVVIECAGVVPVGVRGFVEVVGREEVREVVGGVALAGKACVLGRRR